MKIQFQQQRTGEQGTFKDVPISASRIDWGPSKSFNSNNIDRQLVMNDGEVSIKGGDYILDISIETKGRNINYPYIAGTNGEDRLILRGDFGCNIYIMLPNGLRNLFIDDQKYQIDTSLYNAGEHNCYVFVEPPFSFHRASTKILPEQYFYAGSYVDVQGYNLTNRIHFIFEAYPSDYAWVPVGHNSLFLQGGNIDFDGCWGNDAELNNYGNFSRFSLSQNEYVKLNEKRTQHYFQDIQFSCVGLDGSGFIVDPSKVILGRPSGIDNPIPGDLYDMIYEIGGFGETGTLYLDNLSNHKVLGISNLGPGKLTIRQTDNSLASGIRINGKEEITLPPNTIITIISTFDEFYGNSNHFVIWSTNASLLNGSSSSELSSFLLMGA